MTDTDLSFRNEYLGITEYRSRPLAGCELRESPDGTGGTHLTFTGYASVTEAPYEITDALGSYTETIARSAFDRTLAEGPDVNFLVNHEGVAMARTKGGSLRLSVDEKGLHTEARLDQSRPDVQILRSAIETGAIDEMSFAFRANRQDWDEDYTQRRIEEVNLHHGDVSAVNYGASPHTGGLVGLRSLGILATDGRTITDVRRILELAEGRSIEELEQLWAAPLEPEVVEAVIAARHSTDALLARAHALRLRGRPQF